MPDDRTTQGGNYWTLFTPGIWKLLHAVLQHWGIETTSHYSRDVTFGEDRSRIRTNPGVFARLRSFGFNILKANRAGTLSQDRYRAALGGFDRLSRLVTI